MPCGIWCMRTQAWRQVPGRVNSRSPAVLALSGRGYAVFRSVVNFRFTEFSEVQRVKSRRIPLAEQRFELRCVGLGVGGLVAEYQTQRHKPPYKKGLSPYRTTRRVQRYSRTQRW